MPHRCHHVTSAPTGQSIKLWPNTTDAQTIHVFKSQVTWQTLKNDIIKWHNQMTWLNIHYSWQSGSWTCKELLKDAVDQVSRANSRQKWKYRWKKVGLAYTRPSGKLIAERLSARQLIVQRSQFAFVCMYVYPSHFNWVGAVSVVSSPDY